MNDWVSPASASGWTYANYARDGSTGSRARYNIFYNSWSTWLQCVFAGSGFYSTKIRFWLSRAIDVINKADVDALVDGVWQHVHQSNGPWDGWVEKDLPTPGVITRIRIQEFNGSTVLKFNGYVNEVEAWETSIPVQAYTFVM